MILLHLLVMTVVSTTITAGANENEQHLILGTAITSRAAIRYTWNINTFHASNSSVNILQLLNDLTN